MSFFSLIAVLLIEQLRPLRQRNGVYRLYSRYANFLERTFNAGERRDGTIAWLLAVLPAVLLAAAVYALAHAVSPLLAWAWNAAVLYFTMGFRQFSHAFGDVSRSLKSGDLARARELVGRWRGKSAAECNASEIARVAIEQGLLCSHRHVFGVIFWFLLLPGPAGAVLYRLAEMLGARWSRPDQGESGEFGRFAERAAEGMDWLPARLTAISFAVVGDFEDAVYCWRSQAQTWGRDGIILASGAGALGVRLGESLHQPGGVDYRPELGTGDEADADYLQSTVGLIWRALVLWMLMILLLTVASWVG